MRVTLPLLSLGLVATLWVAAHGAPLPDLHLPPGFHAEVYAEVPGARSLSLGDDGTAYVASPSTGSVYALRRTAGWTRVVALVQGLKQPNGVAWHDGDLYVAEVGRILRYPGIDRAILRASPPQVIRDDLPTEVHHGARYIRFGPDGRLYMGVGVPCNICVPAQFERQGAKLEYGSITRMNADGSGWEVYARGVRNSVGFDWRPGSDELWFTDNGRDMLGDDLPSDELNRAPRAGMHFGYPWCHQGDTLDPDLGKDKACADYTPPAAKMGPHVASLGMRFYTGTLFPPAYRNQVFVARHGSWNRSHKSGYDLALVRLDAQGKALAVESFASGWLGAGEEVSGRPVDVLVMPDGALLLADDYGGKVWRISYKP